MLIRKEWFLFFAAAFIGSSGDCQQGAARYDPDARTYYSAANDSEGIHIRVATADLSQQRKILRNGLELWLDPKARKNKSTGILFPLPVKERSNFQQNGGGQRVSDGPPPFLTNDSGRQVEKKRLHSLVGEQKEMKLVNLSSSSGLSVSLHFAGDTLIYEADIPFSAFPANFSAHGPIGIGIIEKGMQMPDFGGNDMPGGDGGPGGGPPGGGTMPDGPPPGGFPVDDDMQKIFANDNIWFRFTPVLF